MTAAAATAAPTPPRTRRRARGVVLWVVVVVLGGSLLTLAAGSPAPEDYLHPDGTGQGGTRALVEVLAAQGVRVEVVHTLEEALEATGSGADTTVVVGNSDLLAQSSARRLLAGTTRADRLVLLDGAVGVLGRLGLGVDLERPTADPGAAGCSLPWVRPQDRLTRPSYRVVPSGDGLPTGARGCFESRAEPDENAAPVGYAALELPATARHAPLTVFAAPDAATNRFITESEHAGLVLRLLGASPTLVWYHPDAADLAAADRAEDEGPIWPQWLVPASVLAALAFVVFAVARGRRLGALVPEPLPVLVRATETTESRAELYRAAADRARAAAILRRASTTRLTARLGLPPGAAPAATTAAVARATGSPAEEVDLLLHGPDPGDDDALVTLARQLAHLEERIRTP